MSKFSSKPVKIKITGDALKQYNILEEIVSTEYSKGITGSKKQTLFNAIKQKIDFLKTNPRYGVRISKNKIPKKYLELYDVNNLWKINLAGAWRMIYTLKGSEIEIIALILDIFSHKEYEKTFGY